MSHSARFPSTCRGSVAAPVAVIVADDWRTTIPDAGASSEQTVDVMWQLLAPVQVGESRPRVLIVDPTEGWRQTLTQGLQGMEPNETLLVGFERRTPVLLRALLRHRRLQVSGPTKREMVRSLTREGLEVTDTYAIWPSAQAPRVAYRPNRFRALSWAHRSGVVGGGGGRLWRVALARSWLVVAMAPLLVPSYALVAVRTRA